MAETEVEIVVKDYLRAAEKVGIHARCGVLFGSHARGTPHPWSDIDLGVIAPEWEAPRDRAIVSRLWGLRATTDSRIEPIPCGVREWEEDDSRPILEIARREGIVIHV